MDGGPWTWLGLATWLVVLVGWCAYQIGYRRGLRRARTLYEPAIDEINRRMSEREPQIRWSRQPRESAILEALKK
jgi:hypothetical protein